MALLPVVLVLVLEWTNAQSCSEYLTCTACIAEYASKTCTWGTISASSSSGLCRSSSAISDATSSEDGYAFSAHCCDIYTSCSTCAAPSTNCEWYTNTDTNGAIGYCAWNTVYRGSFLYNYFDTSSACPSSVSCGSYYSCSTCAAVSGCEWYTSSATYGASGTCATAGSYPYYYSFSYTYASECPSSASCDTYYSCSTCATVSGCEWYTSSATYGASGTCATAGSYPYYYSFSYTYASECPSGLSCGSYSSCTTCAAITNCEWYTDSANYGASGVCALTNSYSTGSDNFVYTFPAECPSGQPYISSGGVATSGSVTDNTNYIPTINSAVSAVAAVSGILVGGGIIVFILLRAFHPATKSLTPADASILFCCRLGVIQILIGIIGLASSISFIPSILTLAGGAVAVATMKDLKSTDIVQGRAAACSQPLHAANLAIAAIVFSILNLAAAILIKVTVVPFLLLFVSWCGGSAFSSDIANSGWYSVDGDACFLYSKDFAVIIIYTLNGITLSVIILVLSIIFLSVYCQVMAKLGEGANVCGCGRPVTDNSGSPPIDPGRVHVVIQQSTEGSIPPFNMQSNPMAKGPTGNPVPVADPQHEAYAPQPQLQHANI